MGMTKEVGNDGGGFIIHVRLFIFHKKLITKGGIKIV